jgi:PAS domain S-box-containing protein
MPTAGPRWPSFSRRTIVLAYLLVAGAWIALSDRVVASLAVDAAALAFIQTIKGWLFVLVTALLLTFLLSRLSSREVRQSAALATTERRLRLVAENANDIIFRIALSPALSVEYLSPAIERVLGRSVAAFRADPELFVDLVHPDDRAGLDPAGAGWQDGRPVEARMRHADGRWVWIEQTGSLIRDADGVPIALEGVARDLTEQRLAEARLARVYRVQRTLSAANQALVRATEELPLQEAICRAAIDEGGFRFAWVGYRRDDEEGTIEPVARAGHEDGYLDDIHISWHDVPTGRGPTGTAVREGRTIVNRNIASDPRMAPWREAASRRGYASSGAFPLFGPAGVLGALTIYAPEPDAFGPEEVALLEELASDLSYGVEALRTRATAAKADTERRQLAAAITQSADSIMVADAAGRIEYVNPAFERITGYSSAEVLGQNPRFLQSGQHSRTFYEAMWEALLDGRTWVGDVVNRRKDGALFTEESVMSAVRNDAGAITGYVAVKRDVTLERAAQAREQARTQERAQIAQALAELHPEATPEETASAVCRQIVRLPEAHVAVLLAFDSDGRSSSLGGAAASGRELAHRRVSEARTRHLRSRASEGPWVEAWRADRQQPFGKEFRELDIHALAFAPIRIQDEVVGLLEMGAAGPDASGHLAERLPALVEFASIASAVLGPSMASRAQVSRSRELIQATIDRAAFHPVFQPIIDLPSLGVIGYEALSRFDDGTAPDRQFMAAAALGLGPELEVATLRAALAAAAALPPVPWLNVNVSPALILAGEPLRSIIAGFPGQLMLEVTEHEVITDYEAFRRAVAALGPTVQVAVDDAGAGFASLRHIVELRPQVVKIDRSLVAGIDADPARQALLAGLRHFATSQGCRLVAEGIETEAELATLVGLSIHAGQGYLLGRPVPILPRPEAG